MTTSEKKRFFLPTEVPIQNGPLKLNWQLGWLAFFSLTSLLAIVVSSVANQIVLGLVYTVMAILAYVFFILVPLFEGMRTTASGMLFRKGSQQFYTQVGQNRYSSEQPLDGERFGVASHAKKGRAKQPHINRFGRIDFETDIDDDPTEQLGQPATPPVGIAHDRKYGTWSATILASGESTLGASPLVQNARYEAFAKLLNSLAEIDNPVHRLAWRDQTVLGEPQNPSALKKTISQAMGLTPRVPAHADLAAASLTKMGEDSVIHRTTFSLSVHGPSVKRAAKLLDGPKEVLLQQLDNFYSGIVGSDNQSPIGLRSATVLSYNQLVLENRMALDPVFAKRNWQRWQTLQARAQLLDPSEAWPGNADFGNANYVLLGETYHMGFYVKGVSQSGVFADQFWDILKVSVPKIVTTIVEMVPAKRSRRRAEWGATGALGFNNQRVVSNRRVTATQGVFASDAARHEQELAEKEGREGRLRSYIDVTGASLDEVMAHATAITKAGSNAPFSLESLTDRQIIGTEVCMPLTRGLASVPIPSWT
jgi:hypothetical protein